MFNELKKQRDFIHDFRENSTHPIYSIISAHSQKKNNPLHMTPFRFFLPIFYFFKKKWKKKIGQSQRVRLFQYPKDITGYEKHRKDLSKCAGELSTIRMMSSSKEKPMLYQHCYVYLSSWPASHFPDSWNLSIRFRNISYLLYL